MLVVTLMVVMDGVVRVPDLTAVVLQLARAGRILIGGGRRGGRGDGEECGARRDDQ